MRQISGGHEIRPRGGLLLVTTLHFYLYRYFPIAIDRSIREHSFLENLHMGNQGVSEAQEPSNTQEVAAPPHPGWWSSKRATAPALYHIVPSSLTVLHECQHARDPTDGGIATLNTPGPVSFSVKPISDACAPQ